MKRVSALMLLLVAIMVAAPLRAQDPDRVTVNWSDPSRPGLLKVNLINGTITVKAHSGRDVIVQSKSAAANRRNSPPEAGGLRRIDANATSLRVEEENNVMTIGTGRPGSGADIEVEVPAKTNLKLNGVNGGAITVDGVEGEIEVTNVNGGVTVTNAAGSVVAHSTNGNLLVVLRQTTANKPMAFTSLNGNVDVTLPSSTKASLKMRADNGEIYSDFEVQLRPSDSKPSVQDNRKQGGVYRLEVDKSVNGNINGGGPDFELRTFNANIYIRKAK
jgi:hypothetical protein